MWKLSKSLRQIWKVIHSLNLVSKGYLFTYFLMIYDLYEERRYLYFIYPFVLIVFLNETWLAIKRVSHKMVTGHMPLGRPNKCYETPVQNIRIVDGSNSDFSIQEINEKHDETQVEVSNLTISFYIIFAIFI